MARLLEVLKRERVLLMDGAMGSELYQAGLEEGDCGESWNLKRPQRVRGIHQAYVEAGAECLLTNTFQANPTALMPHELDDRLEEITANAVRLARAAAGPCRLVLADIGVLVGGGEEFPFWDDLARVVESFTEQPGRMPAVDGILLETCSSPRALSACAFIRRRVLVDEDVPLLLSLSYRREAGQLVSYSGHSPELFARHAVSHGVTVLGVNCGCAMGLDAMVEVVQRYRDVTDLPILVRPNAGTPLRVNGVLTYPLSPRAFAEGVTELIEAGATLVGGCCGTTPAHIAALRTLLNAQPLATADTRWRTADHG